MNRLSALFHRFSQILARAIFGFFLLFGMIGTHGATLADEPKPIEAQGKPVAPEFKDISEWINTPPLAMKDLKGKVVVVHFMAFG